MQYSISLWSARRKKPNDVAGSDQDAIEVKKFRVNTWNWLGYWHDGCDTGCGTDVAVSSGCQYRNFHSACLSLVQWQCQGAVYSHIMYVVLVYISLHNSLNSNFSLLILLHDRYEPQTQGLLLQHPVLVLICKIWSCPNTVNNTRIFKF